MLKRHRNLAYGALITTSVLGLIAGLAMLQSTATAQQNTVEVPMFEVDAFWPAHKLIVELDSWTFHRGRRAFERDRERSAALQAAGYRVVPVTWRRLTRQPADVAHR